MDDRGRIAISIGVGALVGGVAGYLLLTERGRDLRVNLEPRMNDLLREVDGLRTTFERTRAAVADGLASFNQLMTDRAPDSTGAGPARAQGPGRQGPVGQTPGGQTASGQSPSGQQPGAPPVSGPTLWTRNNPPESTH